MCRENLVGILGRHRAHRFRLKLRFVDLHSLLDILDLEAALREVQQQLQLVVR